MARLPADRTKLNAAIVNQQPSIVASAQANREALIEAYDTIDMLYNFTAGLVAGGTLQPYPHGLYRNAIINGNFDVWQRGTSFSANGYTADRWIVGFGAGGAGTVTRQSFTPGQTDVPGEPQYYIRISQTTPAASGHVVLGQPIEDVRTLAGQTVTLSFYARVGSGNKVIITRVQQNFGSGGSPNEEGPGKVHTITTSWQRFTHTFAVPSISGKTIGNNSNLYIRLLEESNFSTFNLDIACVQLYVGDAALPFQPRSFAEELALCQRYCRVLGLSWEPIAAGTVFNSTKAIFSLTYPTMRVAPTVIFSSPSDFVVAANGASTVPSALTPLFANRNGMELDATVSGMTQGQGAILRGNTETTPKIILDAEL